MSGWMHRGAGAVRSDPKEGVNRWPQGLGPQADEIRIKNFVRCVRGGSVKLAPPSPVGRSGGSRFVRRLDRNGDGKVSPAEFDGPADHFGRLDRDRDGYLDATESPRKRQLSAPRGALRGRKPIKTQTAEIGREFAASN